MPRTALVFAVAVALGALSPPDAGATSCAPTLTWRGVVYHGGHHPGDVVFGARIGTGLVPDCPNPGEEPKPPTPVPFAAPGT